MGRQLLCRPINPAQKRKTMNSILEFKNLSAKYADKPVLNDINLIFENNNNFTALIGPNGSGKSSLINAFFKAENIYISQGEIIRNKKYSVSAVPQISAPVFNFKVIDFIELGINEFFEGFEKYFDEITEKLDLKNLLQKGIKEISAGEYQRVLIAQSLIKKPKIIFLDEPISHLDLKYQIKILQFLKELSNSGILIICVIHNLDFVLNYDFFDNFIFMKQGEITAKITKQEKEKLKNTIENVFETKL